MSQQWSVLNREIDPKQKEKEMYKYVVCWEYDLYFDLVTGQVHQDAGAGWMEGPYLELSVPEWDEYFR